MRLLALGMGSLLCGCVLLHDDAAPGGGGGSGAAAGGGAGAGAGGTGGAGGGGGAGGQPPVCPTSDILFPLSVNMGNIDAQRGVVSPYNGQTTFAGSFTAVWNFNGDVPFVGGFTNYYVATLGSANNPLSAITLTGPSTPANAVTHLIATADGGSVVAFAGASIQVSNNVIPSNQDQGFQDVLIVKLSDQGTSQWGLLLEGVNGDLLVDTLQATPTGLLIGGTNTTADLVFTHQPAGAQGVDSNIITPPGLFLFEVGLDGSGLKENAKLYPGSGRLTAVRDHAGHRYLFGGYSNEFPNFGGNMPVDTSAQQALFVVELNGAQVVSQKAFGFEGRFNVPVGMLDTGDGLAMFGTASGPPGGAVPFRGHPMSTLPDNSYAGYVAKIAYDSTVQWVEADPIDLGGGTTMHSPGLTQQGALVYGYRLGATGSSVTVGGDPIVEPQTDTVFVRRDLDGTLRGSLAAETSVASTRVDLWLNSGPCGDLIVGSYNEDASFAAHPYDGTTGKINTIVDLFPAPGLPFP